MYKDIVETYGGNVSNSDELYMDFFHVGEGCFQSKNEPKNGGLKGNPIVYANTGKNFTGKMLKKIVFEDEFLDTIHWAMSYPENLLNPVSYYGKKKDKNHADKCFGMILDIDDINKKTLNALFYGLGNEAYPYPNYIVISKSGKGMHLYYIFDEPILLMPNIKRQMKELKWRLTRWIWNPYTSTNENVQHQSYDQSFRIAGAYEKMEIYKLPFQKHHDIKKIAEYIDMDFNTDELWVENKFTLEETKEKFPEWYDRRIVHGESKNHWTANRALYDWWIKRIQKPNGASYGHRYWCVLILTAYAIKCGIPFEELKKDAYDLIPFLNNLNPDEPFTADDVGSALKSYKPELATFPIDSISLLTNIRIDKNKRNGRPQEVHVEIMNAIRDIEYPDGSWRNKAGAPKKKDVVQKWQAKNPDKRKIDCQKETGLDPKTIRKWWT